MNPDPAAADPSWTSSPAGYFPQPHHGVPYQVPAQYVAVPQAPGQVRGYATARPGRAQLSRRVRACLIIELVAFTLVLVERFLPDFLADISLSHAILSSLVLGVAARVRPVRRT